MADYAARAARQEQRIRRSLVTPEGVDLSLKLADGGQRAGAFLIDLLIMLGVLIGGTLLLFAGAASAPAESRWAVEAAGVIWLLGFFLLRNGYFILMEMSPRAATLGKRVCGLRVVSRNGGRLTADAVIARNLMREIEVYLPLSFLAINAANDTASTAMGWIGFGWACIFLLFPLFNRDRLRVGDLLAGTWVIRTPKRKLELDLVGEPEAREAALFTREQLEAYGVFELQTLETLLRSGSAEAKDAVAATIRNKIGSPPFETNEAFLRAYYEALRAHLERSLLFGRRRRDKHDH